MPLSITSTAEALQKSTEKVARYFFFVQQDKRLAYEKITCVQENFLNSDIDKKFFLFSLFTQVCWQQFSTTTT